jgi:hypothetical protein
MPKLKYLQLWHNHVHSLRGAEDSKSLVYLGLGENGYAFADAENVAIAGRYCSARLCSFL